MLLVSHVIFTGCFCVQEEQIQIESFEAYVKVDELMFGVVKASGVIWLLHCICCLFVYTHTCAHAHTPFFSGKLCYVCLAVMIEVAFL
jgi:hypothetical protein